MKKLVTLKAAPNRFEPFEINDQTRRYETRRSTRTFVKVVFTLLRLHLMGSELQHSRACSDASSLVDRILRFDRVGTMVSFAATGSEFQSGFWEI